MIKRRKSMAYNVAGPTCNHIGAEQLNRIQNGYFHRAVSPNQGAEIKNGIDFTYKPNRGCFRKEFSMYRKSDFENGRDVDIYRLGSLGAQNGRRDGWIEAWSFYGWRIVVEFFDENAVVDFTGPMDSGACLQYAFGKFLVRYSRRYDCRIINEHLINISSK